MSRGPGALQIQVMQTLKAYHDLGAALGKIGITPCRTLVKTAAIGAEYVVPC